MAKNVRLNHAGLSAILKSTEMHRMVQDACEKIADHMRNQGLMVGALEGSGKIPLPVEVDVITTDRAHGRVVVMHPAGIAEQAKNGVFTKGAASIGIEVKGDE